MSRERILVGGSPGTGKTYSWLTIARALPKSTFHIIDPDDGTLRVLATEDFAGVKNLNYYFTPTWYTHDDKAGKYGLKKFEIGQTGGVMAAFKDIQKKLKPDDWIIVEMLSSLWSMAQGEFVDQIFNKDIGEYFLEARKQMKGNRLEALGGWTDWQVINKMHNDDFMVPVCYELPCHVYMTTSVGVIAANAQEDPEVKAFYGDNKIRLEGQKQNPFRVHSIFLAKKAGKDKWVMSTFVKDRGRDFISEIEMLDFARQYLGDNGWKF